MNLEKSHFPYHFRNINFADFLATTLELDCFKISCSSKDLEIFSDSQFNSWLQNDIFVIFGTGGSSLGAQAIFELAKRYCKISKKILFIDNLDPDLISDMFQQIDFEKTAFLAISKSGETLETLTLIQLVLQKYHNEKNISKKILIITEDKNSTLKNLAKKNNLLLLEHSKNIGGRFSVLSNVGMVPAKIFGLDPFEIRKGAQQIFKLQDVLKEDKTLALSEKKLISSFSDSVDFVIENLEKNITNQVFFVYSSRMEKFAKWLSQLYAESTGKDQKGITPIISLGSIDQHSQLQLYLDGNKDKFFTFLTHDYDHDYLVKDKPLSQIFRAQYKATIMSLKEKKIKVREIVLNDFSPYNIGMLFSYFMLEVITVCKWLNINAFNQPAVERGKLITMDLLKK